MGNEIFAKRFVAALKASNITQKELAKLLGVHPSNITLYKKGATEPDLESLSKIASILHVSPAWLAGLTSDETMYEPTEKEVIWNKIENMFETMDENQMKKVLKFIEDYII